MTVGVFFSVSRNDKESPSPETAQLIMVVPLRRHDKLQSSYAMVGLRWPG
jgi:hypothetical protein